MKTALLSLLLIPAISFTYAQQLVSVSPLNTYTSTTVQSNINSGGWNVNNLDINPVKSFKITYNTTDVHGNATVASGAVYIPQLSCNTAPLLVYEHGTEFVKSNVPSTGSYYRNGLYFSTTGYITVMPDYLGLGDNPGIHLYQHAETEATATIDLIRAVREYLDTASNTVNDNGELFITGYSHGGHSALATLKHIEENNLENEFNVIATAPLSGAYDMVGAQFDMIFDGDSNYYVTPFLPYILGAYQEAYGNIYQNYSDIYDSPYDTQIQNYLTAGTYSGIQWYIMLGGSNYYNFMQDSVLQNMFADTERNSHPINVALRTNSLFNWAPQSPVKLLYCGADSMVSPNNSIYTLDSMIALGSTSVEALNLNNNADHNGCFIPATSHTLAWFDSLSTKCGLTGINNNKNHEISAYPNPAKDVVILKNIDRYPSARVSIISLSGQQVLQTTLTNKKYIPVNHLSSGVYFITINFPDNIPSQRIKFIKQ